MVQTQTTVLPGAADAAVLRLRGTNKAIALTTDCNPRYCYLDPYVGAPDRRRRGRPQPLLRRRDPAGRHGLPELRQPREARRLLAVPPRRRGPGRRLRGVGTPVISGNVSFYNETPERAIFPTPTVGMVGLLPDADKRVTMGFKNEGDQIYFVGNGEATLGGSEYLSVIHGQEVGRPPALDLEAEKRLHAFLREAIAQGLLRSAHDLSEGGLAVALVECGLAGGRGAKILVRPDRLKPSICSAKRRPRVVRFTVSRGAQGAF